MLDFLYRAITVDTYTLVIVAVLSGWAGVLTMQVLPRAVLAAIFVPGFVLGALLSNYLFELYDIAPTPDPQTNVVVACTVGIIVALFLLFLALRVISLFAGLRVERHRFKRDIRRVRHA